MRKILVANRGEIASRIFRTCKRLGMETVAIFSDADKDMPYVREADFSHRIGEPPVSKSYLNIEAIIEVAKTEKVDAIHPGYGLLSENAIFANRVREEGFIFIGPKAETIEKMGDKITSRLTMIEAGVPVVPGSENGLVNLENAQSLAKEIGYPVMLKASGGGGGIGMVLCENEQALNQHYESTKNRAKAYFGSDKVFLEKFIEDARHIEVQIFADEQGHVLHLFERNCSVQRRNQKVIEEAPSPALSDETRKKMLEAAVQAARAVEYINAGTVEFVVDKDEKFYFLEMNTRLQVEHPVTESITGLDLVEWQIKVAQGEELPVIDQSSLHSNGHAMEFRIYAEDPKTFFPSPGKLESIEWEVHSVRIDAGYEEGSTVTPFYDPMIAKVIVSAENRDACLQKAKEFFRTARITGIKSNIPLFQSILEEPLFQEGTYTTAWLTKQISVKN